MVRLLNKTKVRVYLELRKIGATPKQADAFIKKHDIGKKKRRR